MQLVINLLSFFLVLICVFLGLLILVQLPKKEAGMGTAFGADTAVAMFGAGSGNALTQLTKYVGGAFLMLCLVVAALNGRVDRNRTKALREQVNQVVTPAAPVANPTMNLITSPAAATNSVTPAK
jgi:preprotein translocase subunit SecG